METVNEVAEVQVTPEAASKQKTNQAEKKLQVNPTIEADPIALFKKEQEQFEKDRQEFLAEKTQFLQERELPRPIVAEVTLPKTSTPFVSTFKVAPRENRVFRLEGNKDRGTMTIIAVEDVYDPETKQIRRMRLLRGASSIWVDEQKQFEATKGYVEKNTLQWVFQKGRMIIGINDKLKNQAINLSNRNLDNPHRQGVMKEYFKEWNTTKQHDELLQAEELEFEAMGIAASANIDDIIPHAHYLAVDFIDPISGHPLEEKGVRAAYMRKAKADPKKFMNSIYSPVVQMSYKVRRAVEQGKIDLGKQAGQAFFVDGGFISMIPSNRPAIEFLTEFAMLQNEQSIQFANILNSIVK